MSLRCTECGEPIRMSDPGLEETVDAAGIDLTGCVSTNLPCPCGNDWFTVDGATLIQLKPGSWHVADRGELDIGILPGRRIPPDGGVSPWIHAVPCPICTGAGEWRDRRGRMQPCKCTVTSPGSQPSAL